MIKNELIYCLLPNIADNRTVSRPIHQSSIHTSNLRRIRGVEEITCRLWKVHFHLMATTSLTYESFHPLSGTLSEGNSPRSCPYSVSSRSSPGLSNPRQESRSRNRRQGSNSPPGWWSDREDRSGRKPWAAFGSFDWAGCPAGWSSRSGWCWPTGWNIGKRLGPHWQQRSLFLCLLKEEIVTRYQAEGRLIIYMLF